eukprot:GHVS01033930.1.p1 GENE.GHVS01033930.1~~GHVS01033930.1.p1  ORF type:complete len:237 (+),score=40.03 GHVS01033930.1:163-873(+)
MTALFPHNTNNTNSLLFLFLLMLSSALSHVCSSNWSTATTGHRLLRGQEVRSPSLPLPLPLPLPHRYLQRTGSFVPPPPPPFGLQNPPISHLPPFPNPPPFATPVSPPMLHPPQIPVSPLPFMSLNHNNGFSGSIAVPLVDLIASNQSLLNGGAGSIGNLYVRRGGPVNGGGYGRAGLNRVGGYLLPQSTGVLFPGVGQSYSNWEQENSSITMMGPQTFGDISGNMPNTNPDDRPW